MQRDARADIIHASWDLFRDKGFEGTTVDEIIDRAGIAKGTFYHHFQGKSSLLGTLSRDWIPSSTRWTRSRY